MIQKNTAKSNTQENGETREYALKLIVQLMNLREEIPLRSLDSCYLLTTQEL
jgi:hypothetical protein